MPRIAYREVAFRPATLDLITVVARICRAYAADGYSLTLRQLYYQLVKGLVIENKPTEYKRLGAIVDDARYAGLIDWDHIVDRTRVLRQTPHWGEPAEEAADNARTFVEKVMPQFAIEKWANQPLRMEVWIEKDALIDVIARPARALDIPWFACRGYNSTSNAWAAARRVEEYFDDGAERVVVLHLGDHDPEGIDMSRDIEKRFRTFFRGDGYEEPADEDSGLFEVRRIALNMNQIEQYNPPPNTAKDTSSRYQGYVDQFGTRKSWELDALDPPTIDALIRTEVEAERDDDLWDEAVANETEGKELLALAAERWADVVQFLRPDEG